MKIRIASSIALAAALALGLNGCSLIAEQATQIPYAPSDGIDANVAGASVRNLMLIVDESGENFNVVFTGVNTGSEDVPLTINFMDQGSQQATAAFLIEPGTFEFGRPGGEVSPTLVTLPGVIAGSTVDAYLQTPGGDEVQRAIPVLDGTLVEYQDFVISEAAMAEMAERQANDDTSADSIDTGVEVEGATD